MKIEKIDINPTWQTAARRRFGLGIAVGVMIGTFLGLPALAQFPKSVRVGLQAGAPLTPLRHETRDLFNTIPCCQQLSESFRKTMVIGPTLGLKLSKSLSAELEALYRPLRASRITTLKQSGTTLQSWTTRGSIWEFPAVINAALSKGRSRPYVGIGLMLAARTSARVEQFDDRAPANIVASSHSISWLPSSLVNAGVEWNRGDYSIRPEIRYEYWRRFSSDRYVNQAEFFLSFARHFKMN